MTQTKKRAVSKYDLPAVAVDLVIFGYLHSRLSVLLLNRKQEPFRDWWTLPGGFLHIDATLDQTCRRILQAKLGLEKVYLEQLYTFDAIDRDPRQRILSVSYYALINPSRFSIVAGSMANDVQWFGIDELPSLGFDHRTIFTMALQRLQSKIQYNPMGFELLDELFTMAELHELYETILQITIDRRNFRRKMLSAGYLINTGKKREGLQNRHPELYRFNAQINKDQFQFTV